MNRKKIGIFSGTALLVAVVIAAVLMTTVFAKPSTDDYKAAQASMNGLETNYRALGKTYSAYVSDVSDGKTPSKDAYNKALADYNKSLETLSDSKVLKDDQINKAFKAYEVQNTATLNSVKGYVADVATYKKLTTGPCPALDFNKDDIQNLMKNYDAMVATCKDQIATLRKSSNKVYSIYGDTLGDFLEKRRPLYLATVSAYNSGNLTNYTEAFRTLSRNKPDETANKKIEAARQSADATDKIRALRKAIDAKVQ